LVTGKEQNVDLATNTSLLVRAVVVVSVTA